MSGEGAPKAPKTPEDAKKAAEAIDPAKVLPVEGVQGIVELLQKGEWAEMVGAIMTIWKEYFGTPEEKEEIAKARREAQEDKAEDTAKKGLGRLKGGVEEKKEGQEEGGKQEEEEKAAELAKDPELPDGRDFVFIGDSAAHGKQLSFDRGKQPSFIGRDGMTTGEVLGRLRAEKSRLKGKKKAIIYCAGNNILGTPTQGLVDDMVAMARICSEAEIPEIIVNTQYPPLPDYRKDIGEEKFEELKRRNEALRDKLLEAKAKGDFPDEVRIVDLTTPFSNEKNEMKAEYVDPNAKDNIHPWLAYKPAIDYMLRTGKEDDSRVA